METITLSFVGKSENIRIARSVIHNFLSFKGISEQDVFDTELAVNEAIANIIEHTYKFEPNYIVMTCRWEVSGVFEVLLRDFGPKVDPTKVRSRNLEDVRPGGLGVYIIKKIFDVMEFREVDKGNLLYLRKSFK
ncbi:ATP-binding protein [Thermosipho ferrireducens]|uniref:ATP-binding protein n=1 Tax=Thermosipho ferrireducens TaxID=2571116 RepID=A0ABX7SB74_9BACT|nr:ATP-binding protein [Thermosipho ferrireducens]QTA38746.1 ATP-binding protein [Thermosipho ferrireducens]